MSTAQLELLADQILDGSIDVDDAALICDAELRSRRTPSSVPASSLAHPVAGVEADDAGLDRPVGEEGVEIAVSAGTAYREAPRVGLTVTDIRVGTTLEQRERTIARRRAGLTLEATRVEANDTALDQAERWDRVAWLVTRWPVVPFEPGDRENGYLADPTNRKSDAALEREYAAPYTRTVTDFARTQDGYLILDEDGNRVETQEEILTMGSVAWEYRRRSQGRDVWMSRHAYKHVQEHDRARRRRLQQRSAVIRLIRELGGDPKRPEVAAWVSEVGYELALEKLTRRAAQAVAA